jgi:pSer/pThr/pTyr-binding forkhead associated (FHA) protein
VIGRASGCDYRINDPMISRRHCALSLRDNQVWVEDLHSLNGTRVNGEPVLRSLPIANGATLQLGEFAFMFRVEDFSAEQGADTDKLAGARTGQLDSIT